MKRRSAIAALALLAATPAQAQRSDTVRFEKLPVDKPYGPYQGAVALEIGKGRPRPILSGKIVLRAVGPEGTAAEVTLERLPSALAWDSRSVLNGSYRLQIVGISQEGDETLLDEIGVSVANPGRDPQPPPAPAPPPEASRLPLAAPLPPRPRIRLVTRALKGGGAIRGVLRLPIAGAAELPENLLPLLVIERGGRIVARSAEGAHIPFEVNWNTAEVENGPYILRLSLVDLSTDQEQTIDEFRVVVENPPAPPPPIDRSGPAGRPGGAVVRDGQGLAPPPQFRGAGLSSRGLYVRAAANAVTGKNDPFHWIETISRTMGDPHPRVAAAQWALETGWGRTNAGRNNLFGIKARGGQGTLARTTEWVNGVPRQTSDTFADYASPFDAIVARLDLLRKVRYAGYWKAATDQEAARALQKGGYATDPRYAVQLADILKKTP